jgi:hypothetical protein
VALITINTTTPTTPDPALGGGAVTGPAAAGHASTLVSQTDLGTTSKTCLWTGFVAVAGQKLAILLKADWQQDGSLSDGGAGGASNRFEIEFSLNGGGAWSSLRDVSQIQSPSSGTSQQSIPVTQDLTQVRVRDNLTAAANPGETATLTVVISNIRLEITLQDGSVITLM